MIDISKFSGKCDLYDTIVIHGINNIISNYKIYGYNQLLPLEVIQEKDLIPYYPYLVAIMTSDRENGGIIRLSKESFVDSEERDNLQSRLNDVIRYWKKCKRNKTEFNKEEALKKIFIFTHRECDIEIVDRVSYFGDKATIDGIHDPIHDYFRGLLFDEMVNNGWDKNTAFYWIYGYTRKMNNRSE